ncbi:hypothetical protein GCM10029964_070730 [Kibdelosporangium lantanae]
MLTYPAGLVTAAAGLARGMMATAAPAVSSRRNTGKDIAGPFVRRVAHWCYPLARAAGQNRFFGPGHGCRAVVQSKAGVCRFGKELCAAVPGFRIVCHGGGRRD